MNPKRTYKYLIWSGLILFFTGIIGDGQAILILSYGAYFGPILYVVGVIIWATLRIKKPILHPFSTYRNEPVVNTIFLFFMDNFMREFWGFCMAIMMMLILGADAGFKQSDGYKAALEELKNNEELKNLIGDFKRVGPSVGGSISSSDARLGFSVYGSKNSSPIKIQMSKENQQWKLVSLEIE